MVSRSEILPFVSSHREISRPSPLNFFPPFQNQIYPFHFVVGPPQYQIIIPFFPSNKMHTDKQIRRRHDHYQTWSLTGVLLGGAEYTTSPLTHNRTEGNKPIWLSNCFQYEALVDLQNLIIWSPHVVFRSGKDHFETRMLATQDTMEWFSCRIDGEAWTATKSTPWPRHYCDRTGIWREWVPALRLGTRMRSAASLFPISHSPHLESCSFQSYSIVRDLQIMEGNLNIPIFSFFSLLLQADRRL